MTDATEPAVLAAQCSLPAMLLKAAVELDASMIREGRPSAPQRLVIAVLSARLRSLAKDAIRETAAILVAQEAGERIAPQPDLFS